jgi:eukaryotic-like serine/threonine-protein kinase
MTADFSRLAASLAGRYLLERELGAGGMATVYLAEDLKHDRKVAIKVLRPELAAVIGAERFLSEIKTTANLQHPHILPLHDSGEADGFLFYVMPYVEGETVRDRISREKQLPVADAVRIAGEVAAALDYAHRHNVIHRDIKPENILLHDGSALVADFGIALAASKAGGTRITETGMSLGTPHYMSPEQALGEREITARSDVYALGCVLYEMLTGDPPFTGSTAQAVVARVVTELPRPLIPQRHTIPPHVEAAVLTALEKLPADRFATAGEFAEALTSPGFTKAGPAAGRAAPLPPGRRTPVAVLAAVSVLALALAAWGWLRPTAAGVVQVARFVVALPPGEQLYEAPSPLMAVAPDGSGFVYVGVGPMGRRLYWRGFDRFTSRPLVATEDAERPFFSADGKWIGYRAKGKVWKVSLAGGPPQLILNLAVDGAALLADGTIVYGAVDDRGLFKAGPGGGPPVQLTRVDSATGELSHSLPRLTPDGRHVLFTITTRTGPRVAAVALSGGEVTYVVEGRLPSLVSPGYLVYLTNEGPRVARCDPDRLKLLGPPRPIEEVANPAGEPVSELDVSRTGTLVYLTRDPTRRTLVEVDRRGLERVLSPELRGYDGPRYSPDGRRIVLRIQADGFSIWLFDFAAGISQRLTFDRSSYYPEWTPDGSRVVYPSTHNGETGLWWKPASGAGAEEPFFDPPQAQWEVGFARDGHSAVIRQNDSVTGRDLWLLRLPGRQLTPLVVTRFSEHAPTISPDNRFVAYVSDATGRAEVYVRSLSDSTGTWLVSDGGGTEPRWAPDGGSLYYRDGEAIVAAHVETRPTFRVGRRDSLFTGSFVPNPTHANYDVHPSGDRFVMIRMAEGERRAVVVLNWNRELVAGEGR